MNTTRTLKFFDLVNQGLFVLPMFGLFLDIHIGFARKV